MKKNNYALYLAGVIKEQGEDGQTTPQGDEGGSEGEEKGGAVQKLIDMLKDGSLLKELMQASEPKQAEPAPEAPQGQAPATPPQPQQVQQ